jgi:NADPH-dependent 2,4-dienoyl-CoA reductase/sulfur reductase-like enzyme
VRRARPAKTVFESAREIAVLAETDVLVVGGGPAGTAAAIAAARLGAEVLLVERYDHLGGLAVTKLSRIRGKPVRAKYFAIRRGAAITAAASAPRRALSCSAALAIVRSQVSRQPACV